MPTPDRPPTDRSPTDDRPTPAQPSLLDDLDGPVPFALTARARRVVAPESLPALSVVLPAIDLPVVEPDERATPDHDATAEAVVIQDDVDSGEEEVEDDRDDPRRARARALGRAGVRAEAIAAELDVTVEVARRWTGDVVPAPKATHRRTATDHRRKRDLPVAYVTGRAAARTAWRRGAGQIGAAMVAGMAEVTPFAVRLRGEPGVVAGVLQWLRDSQAIPEATVRVQVLSAPSRSMDVVAHEVARQLSVDLANVHARAWRDAPDEEAIEVAVRIGDPRLAGTIDGWRQELLADLKTPSVPLPQDAVAVAG